ncbi:MAG: hypothetical protein ACJA1U_000132 [Bermanella sp.]|jgi:hypothetical protein
MTQQSFPLADMQLVDPDKALIIVKRKREHSRSAVQAEVFDNGRLVGKSGVLPRAGQSSNWLIWEREPGEMKLALKPGDKDQIIENVLAGKKYEYLISDTFWGLTLK